VIAPPDLAREPTALLCGAALAFAGSVRPPRWATLEAAADRARPRIRTGATKPPILRDVGSTRRSAPKIPLDTPFRDENGQTVRLGDLFHGRPVILGARHTTSARCSARMVLNGVVSGLKPLAISAGKDFDVIAVSFNPRETSMLAKAKRVNYLDRYGKLAPRTAGTS
jgi:protein SCO1/2